MSPATRRRRLLIALACSASLLFLHRLSRRLWRRPKAPSLITFQIRTARRSLGEGRTSEALARALALRDAFGERPSIRRLLVDTYLKCGRYEEAQQLAEKCLEAVDEKPIDDALNAKLVRAKRRAPHLLRLAKALRGRGDLASAIATCEEVLADDQDNLRARLDMVATLIEKGDRARARPLIDAVLRRQPRLKEALKLQASCR